MADGGFILAAAEIDSLHRSRAKQKVRVPATLGAMIN